MKPGQKRYISAGKTYLFTQYSTPLFLGGLVAIFIPMKHFKESIYGYSEARSLNLTKPFRGCIQNKQIQTEKEKHYRFFCYNQKHEQNTSGSKATQ